MTSQNEMTVETALANIAAALGATNTSRTIVKRFSNVKVDDTLISRRTFAGSLVSAEAVASRASIVQEYAPFDTTDMFGKGFVDYVEGVPARTFTREEGYQGQCYDRGQEAAMRCARAGV